MISRKKMARGVEGYIAALKDEDPKPKSLRRLSISLASLRPDNLDSTSAPRKKELTREEREARQWVMDRTSNLL